MKSIDEGMIVDIVRFINLNFIQAIKNPAVPGFFVITYWTANLFDLGFLVHYIFTYRRIEFLHLQFFWHGAFVFGRSVKVTSVSRRNHFNFIAHDVIPLNLFAA